MSALALALVLGSALLHALWNALLKRERDIEIATVGVLAVAAASAALCAQLIPGPAFPMREGLYWALAAGVFEAGYFVALAMALARAPLGFAYTVARGGAIALIWPLSLLWLGERVGVHGVVGVAIVCAGLLVLGGGDRDPPERGGLGYSLLCAAGIAGYHVCYKQALALHAQPAALFATSLAVALPLNLTNLGSARRGQLLARFRERPWPLALSGVLCTAAFVVFLHALALAGAAAVLTLRNTSVVFAQVFARAIGERLTPRQVLGAVLVAAGAIALGWPS